MKTRPRAILACAAGLLGSLGCTRTVAPPPAPPAALPMPLEGPLASPEDDEATVVIGSDFPARVEKWSIVVRPWGDTWGALEPLCPVTPCTVSLPYGLHRLSFTAIDDKNRVSDAIVKVKHPTEVVNHTLGRERTSFGTMAGGFLLAAGILTLVLPFGLDMDSPKQLPDAVIGAGIGGIFGGFALMMFDPNIKQHGATTQWQPEQSSPPVAPVGMRSTSFRVRF